MKSSFTTLIISLVVVVESTNADVSGSTSSSKGKGSRGSCTKNNNPVWQDVISSLQSGDVIPMPAVDPTPFGKRELSSSSLLAEEQEEHQYPPHHSLRERRRLPQRKQRAQQQQQQQQEGNGRQLECGFVFSLSAPNQDACLIAGGYPVYADGTFLGCPTSCSIVDFEDVVKEFCEPAFCNMVLECDGDPAIVVGDFDAPQAYCCPKSVPVPP